MKTVLLKFSGPLQSYGTDSHFEVRHTDLHPSKSSVIGMIAAGLGYGRGEDDKINRLNRLEFAVRVDQPGQILRDYHTAKKYKENGELERTYVTNRYYLQDAVFIVALSSDDEELINLVKLAVTKPYYPIYLGRRALPPTADLFLEIVDTDASTALKEYPWQAAAWYQKRHSGRLPVFADHQLLNEGSVHIRNDEVVSFSQTRGRQFNPRLETEGFMDAVIPDKEEHDAFGAIGEG